MRKFARALHFAWYGNGPADLYEDKVGKSDETGKRFEVGYMPPAQIANCLRILYPSAGSGISAKQVGEWITTGREYSP